MTGDVVAEVEDGMREALVILPSGKTYEGRAVVAGGAVSFCGRLRPLVEGRGEIERTWPIAGVAEIRWGAAPGRGPE